MSRFSVLALLVISFSSLALAACGGGSSGRPADNAVTVASNALPSAVSGDTFRHEIPLQGGCGGPYVMQVIGGALPPGLKLDNATHGIVGVLLADGVYDFTLLISDTGCDPFSSTTARFHMDIGIGPIRVVDVLQDGNPSLVPPGAYPFNDDFPALPTSVYNENVAFQFVVAGGVGPYTMKLYDHPSLPDGDLPLGVVIPSASPNLVGAPVEVKPGGAPFLLSFELRDAVGGIGYATLYWKIDTPPIIIAMEDNLPAGTCGVLYNETFFVAEGVPPFVHQLSEKAPPPGYTSDVSPNDADVVYDSAGGPPTVNPPEALVKIDSWIYPAPDDLGPNYASTHQGAPPEGIYMNETTATLGGIPRRRGTFSINYWVTSSLVPNSFGQHAWATFALVMAASGSFAQDPAYTLEKKFASTPPYSTLPDFEVGVVYNPDGGAVGLQLLASGGVPQDGFSDHPHKSQMDADPAVGEVAGAYTWAVDWDPLDLGTVQIPYSEFLASGVLRVVSGQQDKLVPQGPQTLAVTAIDYALPVSLASTDTRQVNLAVGPDTIVITESKNSFSGGAGDYNNGGMNDTWLKVKVMLPLTAGAQVRALDNTKDLTGTGSGKSTIPSTAGSGTTLAEMLGQDTNASLGLKARGTDLLRCTVNPGGWWNDTFNLNTKGGQAFQHGDSSKIYQYIYGMNYAYDYRYQSGSYLYTEVMGANPESSCIRLPQVTTPGVSENRDAGIYTSGGKLYVFDSPDYIGAFVVRPESRIYVPMAFKKSTTGYKAFGDEWEYVTDEKGAAGHAALKLPQMAISPDGRFAAMKLSTVAPLTWPDSYTYTGDRAGTTKIVIFTLTGEKIPAWSNQTYVVISTGANGSSSYSSSTGEYLFAPSLTLTNSSLYYVCGCYGYSSAEYYSWRYHWVYRYKLSSGSSSGDLLTSSDSQWTNKYGSPLQLPMQRFSQFAYGYSYSSGSYQYKYGYTDYYSTISDGYGVQEGVSAPMPFRVSADGSTCVVIAGPSTSNYYGTDLWSYHVWVDDGTSLSRLSSKPRHILWGAARGSRLGCGPNTSYTYHWGKRTGPSTQVEVADDGSRVAVVSNTYTSTMYYYSSGYEWGYSPEVVHVYSQKDGSTWTGGATETDITTSIFATPILWKFGALVFTGDNDGLVFWAGAPSYDPDLQSSTYYYDSYSYCGSLYSYDFSDGVVTHILPKTHGGANDSAGTRYPTDKTNVSYSTGTGFSSNRNIGTVKPAGGFMSANRDFYYIMSHGALDSTKQEDLRLVGINVRSLDGSQDINSHDDGSAFAVDWTTSMTRRGFSSRYGYSSSYFYMYYGMGYDASLMAYWPYASWGPQWTMSRSGRVFWAAHWQCFGPTGAQYQYYGGPVENTMFGDCGEFAGQVASFDANLAGPAQIVTTLTETTSINNYSATTMRAVTYLEALDSGRGVAYVYKPLSSTGSYSYPLNLNAERVGAVFNIVADSTGSVTSKTEVKDISGASGRVSSSITWDSLGTKLFYAFGTAGDEAGKNIYDVNLAAGTSPRKFTFGGDPKRYNALHAGR